MFSDSLSNKTVYLGRVALIIGASIALSILFQALI